MIRLALATFALAAGFALGLGAGAVKEVLVPTPPQERFVYCPIGTTDAECVAARRRYDAERPPATARHP